MRYQTVGYHLSKQYKNSQSLLKNTVYKSLEYSECIAQAQWYDHIFKKVKSGLKCSPVVMIRVHLNLVITTC